MFMMIHKIIKRMRFFTPHVEKRRNILKIIFRAIKKQQPFCWEEISESVENMEKTIFIRNDYVRNILDNIFSKSVFSWESSQKELLPNERKMSLRKDIDTEDDFIRIYEKKVALSLHKIVDDKQELSASLLVTILNLPEDEENLAYCQSILDDLVPADTAAADGVVPKSTAPGATPAADVSAEKLFRIMTSGHKKK